MNDWFFERSRALFQHDIIRRWLRADPDSSAIAAQPFDLQVGCQSIAQADKPSLAIVTGFFIPDAQPPAGETDGPLGALFLARALVPLGAKVSLVTDTFCESALKAGLAASNLLDQVPLVILPSYEESLELGREKYWRKFREAVGPITHLLAIERVGPSHTPESASPAPIRTTIDDFLHEVPAIDHDCCHNMTGRDITALASPAYWLFEMAALHEPKIKTIGIGDGGNEIGMGRIPWQVIRRNISNGGTIACRVPTDYLLVCGISNWGAYALGLGVWCLLDKKPTEELLDADREREVLRIMVEAGPLVDGVLGAPSVSVDGVPFAQYIFPLKLLKDFLV